ncbi:hypothetical protein ETB97_002403 [Aspergillus alliaceus]|uniref:WD-like domain-containing protein n=1 Tax=Petromyces alliaceus TaxID=209559 RepID=A0A5N7BQU8_PETAA|nr:hypothetical protein BDV23DRAFT_191947 [Aspergillus alliaceus]KAF5859794.1 hypothetical protein ETB97_002403 [Aspergillus burnettii]
MHISSTLISLSASIALALATSTTNATVSALPEQLFLDLNFQDIFGNTNQTSQFVEPWASAYVKSIREKRYGDAIWARYHIYGDVEDGIVGGSDNMTVLESIEEDAVEYRLNVPELYTDALSFYAQSISLDTHASDVLEMLRRLGEEDVSELQKRAKTYSISCSTANLAYENSCYTLLVAMQKTQTSIGNIRALESHGNCHLRMGPYRGSSMDSTWWTAHAVGSLIIQECTYVPACCSYKAVSGYSPENSGHRKICLSRKNSGCS